MRWLAKWPLRVKLGGASLLASGLALLLAGTAIVAYQRVSFREEIARKIAPQAEIIGLNARSALEFNDERTAAETLAALRAEPQVVAAAVLGKDGSVFARYIRAGVSVDAALPPDTRAIPEGATYDGEGLLVRAPILSEKERIGSVVIRADLGELWARTWRYAGLITLASAASTLVSLVIARLVNASISRPILDLAATARAVSSSKDYSLRAPGGGTGDEIGELVDRFNEMVGEVERRAAEVKQRADELETRVRERTSELGKANEQLGEQNKRVQEASRLKSEFLANMSHELRTPLNAVIGFSDLLLDEAKDRLSEKHLRYVQEVLKGGKHLLSLINDILDLSKIEAGRVTLALEEVEVAPAIADARALVEPGAVMRRIAIKGDIRARRAVRADRGKLRQVLLNLLSNAVKFSPDGATIEVGAQDDGDFVRVHVKDDGPGIDEKVLARLFEPFVQGENPLTKKHQGTGLGLAISKRLVEQHGGSIAVDTKPGAGATFSFRLPACGAPKPEAGTASSRGPLPAALAAKGASSSGRPLVLVVEDDPASAHLISTHLGNGGYDVVVASSAEDAMRVARERKPAAIALDIVLHGVEEGFRVLGELKRAEATRAIPVVITTVVADRERGIALGAADYLVKPIDAQALLKRLSQLVVPTAREGPAAVLVIDDDRAVHALLEGALGAAGYRVLGAERGREGLEKALRERPEAYVVDLLLPDMTGFDVIAALEADERTRGRPILVFTAADLTADERRGLEERVLAVAEKGKLSPDALAAALQRAMAAAPAPPAAPPAPEAKPCILIVDDQEPNRDLARTLVERIGYRVELAEDGVEGVEKARSVAPRLILLDLAMPRMDGYEAARRLKASPETQGIPLVALTALAMRGDEEKALAAGFQAYLTKPIDRKLLESTIVRFLGEGVAAAS